MRGCDSPIKSLLLCFPDCLLVTISLARQQVSQAFAEQGHMILKQLLQGIRVCYSACLACSWSACKCCVSQARSC